MSVLDRLFSAVETTRADSWLNVLTGFGTARDKTTASTHVADPRLSDEELTSLFNHNDIAKRIVSLIPREAFRQGHSITCANKAAKVKLLAAMKPFNVPGLLEEAWTWGRLYGGAALFVGADDGQEAHIPLDVNRITSIDFLDLYDRRSVQPHRTYEDVKHHSYSKPRVYAINHDDGGISYVHASRLILFGGVPTDRRTRVELQSWDYSVLQAIYRTLAHFDEVFQASRLMMSDASQGVFKLRGLLSMLAGGQKKELEARAVMLDTLRSVSRAIFLDAESGEEFTKVATQFAGIGDVLMHTANRLAAGTGYPVAVLMGQSPAGLQATGASDIRLFYDSVQSDQINYLLPRHERLIRLFAIAAGVGNEQFDITYNQLWQESPKEKADRRLVIAQADQAYIQSEVYTPEEVAEARSQKDGLDVEIRVEENTRDPAEPTPSRLVPPLVKPPPSLPPPRSL